MLKLEAGKRYWMRYGAVTGVVRLNRDAKKPFTDGVFTWSEEGKRWSDENECEADLVREYTELQPLEWKRGIPTEEECRECWIVLAWNLETSSPGVTARAPMATTSEYYSKEYWYIALRIKPVEPPKPKTKTITLQQFTHTSGDKRWMVVEDGEMAGCWTATGKTKTVEVPCE